jgi:DNA-binding transcriptional regulator GbsR (MarR family)
MRLTPVMHRYIVHWGEMGSRWGINRSVAQIHALLYLAPNPLHADEIAETLGIARSNVSVGIKELLAWDLVQVTHTLGDRRDFFVAQRDPWEVIRVIVEGRKRREIDPTLAMLRDVSAAAEADEATPQGAKAKIGSMLTFLEEMNGFYAQWRDVPQPVLRKILTLGLKVTQLLGK